MRFTTEALVIRENSVGESDRSVALLTKDYGLIRAFAPGAKKFKSRKGAATGLLSFASFTIEQKKDTYRIIEAAPMKIFFGAGSDIVRLSLSQYFCELANVFSTEGESRPELYRLILNSINFLAGNERNPELIKAITELRLMSESGYMPDLVACRSCAGFENKKMYFDINDGCLLCADCRKNAGVPLDDTLLTAMRHIVYSQLRELYSFEIPEKSAGRLSDITERYLTLHTDHNFSTLNFYRSIK